MLTPQGFKTTALITTLNYVRTQDSPKHYLPLHEKLLNFTNIFRFTEVFSLYFLSCGFNLSEAP
jgi:hypothetical protein